MFSSITIISFNFSYKLYIIKHANLLCRGITVLFQVRLDEIKLQHVRCRFSDLLLILQVSS